MNRFTARIYDRMFRKSEEAGLTAMRRDALADARGEVLEIGAGTGLNLRAYPRQGITRIVATEPHPAMSIHLADKVGDAPAPVEIISASAEELPFPDATFDTVVGTLVLCEPEDPARVVEEIARVLKPGGRYLFLEHVRSDEPKLARKQDRWAPLWRTATGGCNCNRSTLATIEASGLDVERASMGRFPKSPEITRPLLRGAAVRGDYL
ncbi:MAG TPA: class I SAM-dependent methyltransferase [Solirubrobacteraceae bacterium]